MGVGNTRGRFGAMAVTLLAAAVLCLALAADAGATRLVGKDGKVHACYKAKGKSKGAVRLVPKKAHCRRGEKKISWNAAGPAGEAGRSGENGAAGEGGPAGERGATLPALEQRITALTDKVTELEGVLKGITNTELLGALSKLQGISPTQLQEAVSSVAKVTALCSQTSQLTGQSNALGGAIGGLNLIGALPGVELEKTVPIPTPLSSFACP